MPQLLHFNHQLIFLLVSQCLVNKNIFNIVFILTLNGIISVFKLNLVLSFSAICPLIWWLKFLAFCLNCPIYISVKNVWFVVRWHVKMATCTRLLLHITCWKSFGSFNFLLGFICFFGKPNLKLLFGVHIFLQIDITWFWFSKVWLFWFSFLRNWIC